MTSEPHPPRSGGGAALGRGALSRRDRLLEETSTLVDLVAFQGLPEQTSSLLDSNVTLQQLRVLLFVLRRGPVPISQVAGGLGVRPNVATGIVQRLVERQMVQRHEVPDDRRVRLLTVTDHGRELIEELGAVVHERRREMFERLSDQQLGQLREILRDLAR